MVEKIDAWNSVLLLKSIPSLQGRCNWTTQLAPQLFEKLSVTMEYPKNPGALISRGLTDRNRRFPE
ncbi:hypothetical protein [Peribacillus simplex]|uniref:hypothetical protein n=1 Tax=Peribacillus simplex TaxID=1478 RepID=UPI0012D862B4|nr:hypothetical protein [Peribacillus simplex]